MSMRLGSLAATLDMTFPLVMSFRMRKSPGADGVGQGTGLNHRTISIFMKVKEKWFFLPHEQANPPPFAGQLGTPRARDPGRPLDPADPARRVSGRASVQRVAGAARHHA